MNTNFDQKIESEYRAVRETGAGIFRFPQRGLIEVSGGEAVQFLNGLVTNDVKKLEDSTWMRAAFPNAQGRLLAMTRVLRRGDRFLFDVDAANHAAILQNLMRFTFAGDFKVADLSDELQVISLFGARAQEMLENFELRTPKLDREIVETVVHSQSIAAIKSAQFAASNFDLFVPQDLSRSEKTVERFVDSGAVEIGEQTREILRVEMGTPFFGVDMDDKTVVLETGLDDAVSFTKGCYIGQEIIARIHFRGHVAKKLTGLMLEETGEISAGDNLKSATGKAAGRITSTVFSPILNKTIALGFVRHEFLRVETELFVVNGERELRAKVVEPPFIG